MHQSFPAAPSAPLPHSPRANPRALAFFFLRLGWEIPGSGDSWAVKSPGVGTKKEGKYLVLRQNRNIFSVITQSSSCYFNERLFCFN